ELDDLRGEYAGDVPGDGDVRRGLQRCVSAFGSGRCVAGGGGAVFTQPVGVVWAAGDAGDGEVCVGLSGGGLHGFDEGVGDASEWSGLRVLHILPIWVLPVANGGCTDGGAWDAVAGGEFVGELFMGRDVAAVFMPGGRSRPARVDEPWDVYE